jgi:hypothetical protein
MTHQTNQQPSADSADRELAAALHALAAPMLRARVEPYVNRADRAIDFPALLARPWSTTERAMIEVACTLWGREDLADARLSPLLYAMDDANFVRVIEAMLIRRGAHRPGGAPIPTGPST